MSVLCTFIAVMGAQIYILAQPLLFFTPFHMNDPKLWLMRFASSAPPPHFWWDLLFPCPYSLHLIRFESHFQHLNTGLCSESELHLVSRVHRVRELEHHLIYKGLAAPTKNWVLQHHLRESVELLWVAMVIWRFSSTQVQNESQCLPSASCTILVITSDILLSRFCPYMHMY